MSAFLSAPILQDATCPASAGTAANSAHAGQGYLDNLGHPA